MLDLEQTEKRLTLNILGQMLALYLLRNSKIPLSKLMQEIFDAEMEVGEFVSSVLQMQSEQMRNLHGVLGNSLSVMPMRAFSSMEGKQTAAPPIKLKRRKSQQRSRKQTKVTKKMHR